jgi:predicted secreted protein
VTVLIVHWAVLVSAFAVFFFLTLFCLFPIGLGEVDSETGAPKSPMILRKMTWAAGIAVVLWLGFYSLIYIGVVDL